MMENSDSLDSQAPVGHEICHSNQEVLLLTLFRVIGAHRQLDILRLLEVFALIAAEGEPASDHTHDQ